MSRTKRTPHTNGTRSKEDYKQVVLDKIDEATAELVTLRKHIEEGEVEEAIHLVQEMDGTMLDIEENLDHYSET